VRVPIAWLRDYVQLPADAKRYRRTPGDARLSGGCRRDAAAHYGVVVGKLTAIEKHPNADRLVVCTVDIGANRTLTIATAATNVAVGQVIPVATIGAKLPD